jgi:hypothetical protein
MAMVMVVVVVVIAMVVVMIRRTGDDFALLSGQREVLNRNRVARESERKAQVHHRNGREQEFRVHTSILLSSSCCLSEVR